MAEEEDSALDLSQVEAVDVTKWTEKEEDEQVRNLYKADMLLDDVLFRMNLYHLASEHYGFLNNTYFVTPNIIITSIASFLSFMAASTPESVRDISLLVGFLGTCATIITAMQSAYKYDARAEMFRGAAAEFRLLQTRINACFRKDGMTALEWAALWVEVEVRMTEMQKKMAYFPEREKVAQWDREGRLRDTHVAASTVPPWLVRYLQNLEDDGIQTEEDIRFIPDELFDLWIQPKFVPDPKDRHKNTFDPDADLESTPGVTTRYPKAVIAKLKEIRNRLRHKAAKAEKASSSSSGSSLALHLKPTTQAALSSRGMNRIGDLRHASDQLLDNVLDELIRKDEVPVPVAWAELEEMIQDVKRYGRPMPALRTCACYHVPMSVAARARCERVVAAANALTERTSQTRRSMMAASGSGALRGTRFSSPEYRLSTSSSRQSPRPARGGAAPATKAPNTKRPSLAGLWGV